MSSLGSFLRKRRGLALSCGAVAVLAAVLACGSREGKRRNAEAQAAGAPSAPPPSLAEENPAQISGYVLTITDKGKITQEVFGEQCYLYEKLNIAYLRHLHVDFYEPDTNLKDTLDAPEGYLYLQDFVKDQKGDGRITPSHPFYKKIGGAKANLELLTTSTRLVGELPREVARHRNDIDLMGHLAQKVVYCRSDGTSITCLRAYRDSKAGVLYGMGDCVMRRVINNQVQVTLAEAIISDDKIKKLRIRKSKITVDESTTPAQSKGAGK